MPSAAASGDGVSHHHGVPPHGEFELLTALYDADGKDLGIEQAWKVSAKDGVIVTEPGGEVAHSTYVSELELTSDACGNGRAKAVVAIDPEDTRVPVYVKFEVYDDKDDDAGELEA